ncbi:MAG: TetR/AcrR family transcriptional regulator [Myxococcaceae bacterium]
MAAKRRAVEAKVGYHHGNLKEALLAATLQVLEEGGPSAVTLREVARRAGVSHAAPYRHYADLDALLADVAEEGFRGLTREMRTRMDAESAPGDKLRATGIGYVAYAVKNTARFRLMFGPQVADPRRHPGLHAASEEAFQVLVEAVQKAQAANVFPPGDVLKSAVSAWAMVHGLAMLYVDGQLDMRGIAKKDAEKFAAEMLSFR